MAAQFTHAQPLSGVAQIRAMIELRIEELNQYDHPYTELALDTLRRLLKDVQALERPQVKPAPTSTFRGNPVAIRQEDLVTDKQEVAMRVIACNAGLSHEFECLEVFGCAPENLTRRAASWLIDHLKAKACESTSLDRDLASA
jgi:hypothetical protein